MGFVSAQPSGDRLTQAQREVERQRERLEDAVERYNYACHKLEQTRGEMAENEAEIAQAEAELASNKTRLNGRVRAMYMARHNEFLDVVVNAGSFDEFLVGLDLAKKVGRKDAEMVRGVKEAKARLESARQTLAQREAEQAAARKEMAESKAAVERDLAGAEGIAANVEAEIRQAMAARAAQAATSTGSRRSYPTPDPVVRRAVPPGTPHPGVVDVAYAQLGKPYVWGASGPNSFDCSGLVKYCYRVGAGINISHSSYAQAYCGTPVSVSELAPGDILGFRGWGHVGLYVGGGEYIHAPQSGDVVRVASLAARRNYCGAVRP
ncbi:MAG: C40 family peptidase [Gemmatimonadetes bacterium]|nr:C40 family peptidase [Gemmatimonadota bacterium]